MRLSSGKGFKRIDGCCAVQTREERFRETSESTNRKLFNWALLQTITLMLTGIMLVQHLKHFFRAKKIV